MTTRRYDNDAADDSARFLRDQDAAARHSAATDWPPTREELDRPTWAEAERDEALGGERR